MALTSGAATRLESFQEVASRGYAVAVAAHRGLTATPKTLPPWLFYDETGSSLFEEITRLPEYYLTRTERALLTRYAGEIFDLCHAAAAEGPRSRLRVIELGAGTATKTGVLLGALARRQLEVCYQPIDISPSALEEAAMTLTGIPGLKIRPSVANYVTDPVAIERTEKDRVLALYIGSSVGNFSPDEARSILQNLRENLRPGDALLLGTDLAPSRSKSVEVLLAAYNDPAGVTASFNRNILRRLNAELRTNFQVDRFRHHAIWNRAQSRIEMHLQSTCAQLVNLPINAATRPTTVRFESGETIHTENSYKFTNDTIAALLGHSGFSPARTFSDDAGLFAVTLATAV